MNIIDASKMIQVCVALHNYIMMNTAHEDSNVPPAFVHENQNNVETEDVNDELPEELAVMPTNEKLMWMIQFGEI